MCRNSQCQQLSQSKYPFTKNYLTHSKAVDLTVGGASIRQWGSATIDSNSFSGSAAITGVLRMTGGWGGYIRADAFYIFANSAKGIIFANSAKGIVLERYTNGSNAYSWPLPQIRRNKFTIAASQFRRAVSAPYAVLDPALGSSIDATHNIWGVGDVPANVAYIIDDYYDHQEETPKKAVVNFQPYDLDGGGGGGGGGYPYVFA